MGARRSAGRRLEVVASHLRPVAEEAAYRDLVGRLEVGRLEEDRLEEAAYRDPVHHPAEEVVSCRRLAAAAVACDERTVPLAWDKAAFGAWEWQSRGHRRGQMLPGSLFQHMALWPGAWPTAGGRRRRHDTGRSVRTSA